MPSENLDLVRSILAPHARGDFRSTEWAHPEIELIVADGPEPGRSVGIESMARQWREFLGNWERWRVEAYDYLELDPERVLVLFHYRGRGKTSGVELASTRSDGATVYQIHDRKIVQLSLYWDREIALADLGLSSDIGS